MGSGKAISGMVLGILSIVLCLLGLLPLIMGIVGITLSGISLKKETTGRGMAITGLVTGIIGSLFSLIYTILWAAVASTI